MIEYEIEVDGEWITVEARSAREAVELYTRAHAAEDGWSDRAELCVRSKGEAARAYVATWEYVMTVNVRSRNGGS